MQEKTAEQPTVVLPRVEASTSDFLTLHEIIAKARANLDQNCWDYIVGGTETETTLRRNRMALDTIAFRPRVLRDVSRIDTSVERFGRKLRMPVMLAPVGSLESFNPEGAAPIVRGAGAFGAAHMLSSVCEPGSKRSPRPPPTPRASSSSTCAATTPLSTTMSAAPSTTAMLPSA